MDYGMGTLGLFFLFWFIVIFVVPTATVFILSIHVWDTLKKRRNSDVPAVRFLYVTTRIALATGLYIMWTNINNAGTEYFKRVNNEDISPFWYGLVTVWGAVVLSIFIRVWIRKDLKKLKKPPKILKKWNVT